MTMKFDVMQRDHKSLITSNAVSSAYHGSMIKLHL